MSFISAKEASEKWGITRRRVQLYCEKERIEGAFKVGNTWAIPSGAEKPVDLRKFNNKKQK